MKLSFRYLLNLLLVASALAQSGPQLQNSHTEEDLRGVSAVSREVAWASGTHGTYLRTTDGGRSWLAAQVPGAESLDFRAIVAFSASEAFLMSSGPGHQSRIYYTSDAGQRWALQFTNSNPKGFFDSMAFWDAKHGIVLGDPIADESGKLKFELLATDDGQTWRSLSAQLPVAQDGEGAFAASNTCLSIRDSNIWFATGGKAARVFHSPDRGKTWQVFDTPVIHGPDSAGIFSIAFRDAMHGVIAGGDYKHSNQDGPNLALTSDGGQTWTLSPMHPQAYFSAGTFDRSPAGNERLFLVGQDFVLDFGSPSHPKRIDAPRKSTTKFNAISAYPAGGVLVVGAKGAIASIP